MIKNKIKIITVLMILMVLKPLVSFANGITEEDITIDKNPDRGFYKLVQRELQTNEENFSNFEEEIKSIETRYPEISLISFQLNLINYVNGTTKISTSKVNDINKYFSIMREHGYKVIFRVVYDSKGQKNPEPEFNIILSQIEDLRGVYTTNEDIIFVVEAGYLGSYGEWHDGKYDKNITNKNQIIKKLLEVVPEKIQINLRKPMFITDYIGSKNTITEINAYSNEEIARLGLHNDGYLASETDLGTFEKNEREENLRWQSEQTKYTAFGGEVQNKNSSYNDLNNAIKDMFNRHCNYLNRTYDNEVKEKWANTKYNGDDKKYIGQTGMTYIKNHLGYRLLLKEVDIKGNKTNESANTSITMNNIGFGNIVVPKKVSLIYKNEKNSYEIETDIDIRKKSQNNMYNLQIDTKLPYNMEEGNYEVYLKIGEIYDTLKSNSNYYIKLVNKGIWNEEIYANYIGNVIIEKGNNQIDIKEEKNKTENLQLLSLIKILIIGVIILIIALIVINNMQNKRKNNN